MKSKQAGTTGESDEQILATGGAEMSRTSVGPQLPAYDPATDPALVAVVTKAGDTVHVSPENAEFMIGRGAAKLAKGEDIEAAREAGAAPAKPAGDKQLDADLVTGTNVVTTDVSAGKAEAAKAAKKA